MIIPEFVASCSGSGEGAPYRVCPLSDTSGPVRRVVARLQSANATGIAAHLAVSYEYEDPSAECVFQPTVVQRVALLTSCF